jgi:hypothetical protein
MKVNVAALQRFFLGVRFPFTAWRGIELASPQELRGISAFSTVAATTAGSYLYPEGEKL